MIISNLLSYLILSTSHQNELDIHHKADCQLESVKLELKNLVNQLEEPLKISLQNSRDRLEIVASRRQNKQVVVVQGYEEVWGQGEGQCGPLPRGRAETNMQEYWKFEEDAKKGKYCG